MGHQAGTHTQGCCLFGRAHTAAAAGGLPAGFTGSSALLSLLAYEVASLLLSLLHTSAWKHSRHVSGTSRCHGCQTVQMQAGGRPPAGMRHMSKTAGRRQGQPRPRHTHLIITKARACNAVREGRANCLSDQLDGHRAAPVQGRPESQQRNTALPDMATGCSTTTHQDNQAATEGGPCLRCTGGRSGRGGVGRRAGGSSVVPFTLTCLLTTLQRWNGHPDWAIAAHPTTTVTHQGVHHGAVAWRADSCRGCGTQSSQQPAISHGHPPGHTPSCGSWHEGSCTGW